jgi:hypothetical protein
MNNTRSASSLSTSAAMPRGPRLVVLKIVTAVALIAASFWLTLEAIDHYRPTWQPISSNKILTFGKASASPPALTPDTKFQFAGSGYIEIQGTEGLRCLTFRCHFTLMVTFYPTNANPQLILGQSNGGEDGWHLLFDGGRLLMQSGADNIVIVAFHPTPMQPFKFDIVRGGQETRFSIDDVIMTRTYANPFTDIAQNLTLGGRAGPTQLSFTGAVSDVQIAKQGR